MKLTAYLDESGTDKDNPITLMAGFVGLAGRWHLFDKRWQGLLDKHGLSRIHTKNLADGSGEFSNREIWPRHKRGLLYAKAERMVRRHAMFGIVAFLHDIDFEQLYAAGERPKKIPLDTKYGLCFRACLSYIFTVLEQRDLVKGLDLTLILDQAPQRGDARRIFDEHFVKHAQPEQVEAVSCFAFRGMKGTPGLQGADVLAYPALRMELERRAEVSPTPVEQAELGTSNNRRKCPVFRVPISTANLTEHKANLLAVEETRRAWWRQGGGSSNAF